MRCVVWGGDVVSGKSEGTLSEQTLAVALLMSRLVERVGFAHAKDNHEFAEWLVRLNSNVLTNLLDQCYRCVLDYCPNVGRFACCQMADRRTRQQTRLRQTSLCNHGDNARCRACWRDPYCALGQVDRARDIKKGLCTLVTIRTF